MHCIFKALVQLTIPSGIQALVRVEIESIEFMSAEAVAVWYGIIDSTHELNSTGNLITQTQHNATQLVTDRRTRKRSFHAMRECVRCLYLRVDWDCERGLLDAMRNGERTGLASDATRNADLGAEHDRNIDLAAADAIFWIGIVRDRRRVLRS